ncbi:MAG: restriction endonuclease subunit S [Planctomycetaceae bacterium]
MKAGWTRRRLGDVVTRLTNGYVGPTRNIYIESGIPYLLARHVRSNSLAFDGKTFISEEFNTKNKKSKLKTGDVLLVQSGHIGHSAVVPKEHEGHNCHAMIVITPIDDGVTGEFLSLYFNSPEMQEKFQDIRSGSTVPHLTCKEVKELAIPVPPLAEQRRIVGILDEAFEGIATAKANAEKNLQNARALFESHLQSVFTQRGEGWVVRKVAEIAKKSLGKMLDKAKNKGDLQPYLRNLNVRWFTFDLSDLTEMRFLEEEAEKYMAVKGDVLICEGGYPGRAAIWNEDYPIHFQKAIHRVRFHELEQNQWFVYFLYVKDMSGELRQHFTGTGIQHFTGESLGRFEIPIPPLPLLRKLVAKFDGLATETQRLESICQRKLAALDDLKKSLLHQAFSGQLTKDN